MELKKISDYMTVKDAASFLGISVNALRNWSREGKIQSYRNPMSNYRLFLKEDLEKLLVFEKE